MYICIVPVTQLQREQRVFFYISHDFPLHIVGGFFSIPSVLSRVFRRGTRYIVCCNIIKQRRNKVFELFLFNWEGEGEMCGVKAVKEIGRIWGKR